MKKVYFHIFRADMIKRITKLSILPISIILMTVLPASSQSGGLFGKNNSSYSSIGIGAGSSHYLGDLAPYRFVYYSLYSNVRWNGTLNYQYHFNPYFSARFGFSYIRLFGNDATLGGSIADEKLKNQRLRNLHFRNDLMEFAISGIYTILPLEERKHRNQRLSWSPYIGVGAGIISHDPKARGSIQDKYNNYQIKINPDLTKVYVQPWESLRPIDTELGEDNNVITYSSISLVFPIILGIKTKLNSKITLGIEGSWRISTSDYLDDVGNGFYNPSQRVELSYRADEDYNAVSGKSRLELFEKMMGLTGGDNFPSVTPSKIDRLKPRGTHRFDSYLVTQITLNYNISDKVKCPPIK